jgi:SAM-dependent methyltransferase
VTSRAPALTGTAREAWHRFLGAQENRGHAHRELAGEDLVEHVSLCLGSARATVARIRQEIGPLRVRTILDVGCSTGFNSLALQEAFPGAEVTGVEPEEAALDVARAMAEGWPGRSPVFLQGVGERLPLADRSVDLVVCHTVLEHVFDVDRSVAEIARVLAPGGAAHVEAPNYLWPAEPHLDIWCVPLLGKPLMKRFAALQGKGSQTPFLDHLQLIHPWWLKRLFRRYGLSWEDRAAAKLRAIAAGEPGIARRYPAAERLLVLSARTGLSGAMIRVATAAGLYPSVLFTLRRDEGRGRS